ncbi:MAG: hypothetical protein J6K89_05560 [Oscillospiraceae bacterium]|nr:hypothetical protein [Oscillospiraceae bacterium]
MFYTMCIVIVMYNLLMLFLFRCGANDYFRLCKMSKSYIRKKKKGFRNFWFYEAIHKERSLGILYPVNALYLLSSAVFSVLALSLGYVKGLQPMLFILSVLLCTVQIPASILASVYSTMEEFGRPFVLLAVGRVSKKPQSSLRDLLQCFGAGFLVYLLNKYL